ncbi:hypothetical protein GCM10010277_48580 [Streptomyces longisporoflavus]|nr:hypothetical protein GCM10010277_48580 [Streptomyces longisporoflavus]
MRVVESVKFASMPTRRPAHTFSVNSMSAMRDMFHLIRLFCEVKGLCTGYTGHPGDTLGFNRRDRLVNPVVIP